MHSIKPALLVTLVALAAAVTGAAQDTSAYRVVIQQVNSTNFPEVELRFQVFIQDIGAAAWDPTSPLAIQEYVLPKLGSTLSANVDASDIGDVEVCDERPVIMSVAIDVSGSVAGVLPDIKAGVTALFDRMQQYADQRSDGKRDWGGVLAFASSTFFRYPDATLPVDQLFTDGLQDISTVVKEIPGGGASPIWVNMEGELDRTLAFEPGNSEYKRVLATLTDGQNNQAEDALPRLLSKAQLGGAQLFNLGYGQPNAPDLQRIALSSGGAFVPGAEQNIAKALIDLLNSVRTTYCVKYRSPFADQVNEPATVVIETGNTRDVAAYPLPFLIPEDSTGVTLFFPTTRWMYDLISGGSQGNLPQVKAKMLLRSAADPPAPWAPASGEHPPRRFEDFEVPMGTTQWTYTTGPASEPWKDRIGFEIPVPDELLAVPTDYVDLGRQIDPDRPDDQLLSGVQHYLVTAEFDYSAVSTNGGVAQAGRQYPSATRLSVQDRTPPSLFARLRPQDGGPVLELTLRESDPFNQDTRLVERLQLTREAAQARGFGDKRADLVYRWRTPDGEVTADTARDQLWSREPEDGSAPPEAGLDEPAVVEGGLRIPEQQRLTVEVLARDNFALAGESTAEEDRGVWDYDQLGVRSGVPIHAVMDRNREEAQVQELRPPFLPVQPHGELETRPRMPGVAWWVEANPPDLETRLGLRDPDSQLESLPVMRFRYSDDEILQRIQETGEAPPPAGQPLRWFMLRAQDGQGGVTLVRLPLYVGDVRFDPLLVDWKRRRDRSQE